MDISADYTHGEGFFVIVLWSGSGHPEFELTTAERSLGQLVSYRIILVPSTTYGWTMQEPSPKTKCEEKRPSET